MRHYRLVFTTKGPVHIGNGETLGKKDYFFEADGTIAVLDVSNFAGKVNPDQLEAYCRFLEEGSGNQMRSSNTLRLSDFLRRDKQLLAIAKDSVLYRVSSPLTRANRGSYQYHDVQACIKDAEGKPYVPGSSVKGLLRTALLIALVNKKQNTYRDIFDNTCGGRLDKDSLAFADERIEREAFWNDLPDPDDSSSVRDVMRYVSVSDSEPLDSDCLVFAKKYDKFSKRDSGSHKKNVGRSTDCKGNQIDLYRECIKPGTSIAVDVDIDERIDSFLPFKLDASGLQSVLEQSMKVYQECFLKAFDVSDNNEGTNRRNVDNDSRCRYVGPSGLRCKNQAKDGTGYCRLHQSEATKAAETVPCYLGGGVGYASKTVVNSILSGDKDRVEKVSRILYEEFPTRLDPAIHEQLEEKVLKRGFVPEGMKASYKFSGELIKAKDDHRHWEDASLGVSPHTLKLGIIGNKKYQMGLCDVRIEERS